ncbi:MAG: hypothetical protein EOP10_00035 [Proteobacteria bacterium]|nr:MAG: hypothetical protein EOP10_00035 [Pseudomonadota bacterium]
MIRSLASLLLFSVGSAHAYGEARMSGFESPHRPNQFIVHYKSGMIQNRTFLRSLGVAEIKSFDSSNALLLTANGQRSASVLEFLRHDPAVESIQANHIYKIMTTPNDPRYGLQYVHKKIGSAEAWDVTTGSKDVVVAIIDSGVNYNHPDIAPNYWTNVGEIGKDGNGDDKSSNGMDDDGNGYIDDFRGWDFVQNDNDPMDDNGHGTHCAGAIAAKGDNDIGVTGVSWNVSIVGLKFIDGKTGEGDTAGAVAAIEYATKMGFPITSNSWGGPAEGGDDGEPDILKNAIQANADKGYLFVAAAGNDGKDNDNRTILPAGYEVESILTVGATTLLDRLAFFSNYGEKTVDLGAPGSLIYSTVLGSGYSFMSGTSMAAPIVAGAAGLLKSQHPDWTGEQIKAQLIKTVDPIPSMKTKLLSGGRLNIGRALTE